MKARSVMILGTASGVGKSFIAAGLCRLFSNWGYRVAPFKAQNMSNNSYVTPEGGEMGRAQVVQAECARKLPHTDMNPVLLKPSEDCSSQVVLQGKAIGNFSARNYFKYSKRLWNAVCHSYKRLSEANDVIVMEGAGSPAEVNLKRFDFVNMKMALHAKAKCILVADIDRGGVFASVIGTLDLLNAKERAAISGIIINKFRGDVSLFRDGIKFIEKRTGKSVLGVIPYDRKIRIEEEDSIREETHTSLSKQALDIAILLHPRMSNFTDFDVLRKTTGLRVRYIRSCREFGSPDLLILPGTKATIADWHYLKANGFAQVIWNYAEKGGRILGICGGFQMMGSEIRDPKKIESRCRKTQALGLFKMKTCFDREKILKTTTEQIKARIFGSNICAEIKGYEIHMGRSRYEEKYPAFGKNGAVHPNGRFIGSYCHGLFDAQEFRGAFLKALARSAKKKSPFADKESWQIEKEKNYNALSLLLEENLNVSKLKSCIEHF